MIYLKNLNRSRRSGAAIFIEDLYQTVEKIEVRIELNMMHNKVNIEFLTKTN